MDSGDTSHIMPKNKLYSSYITSNFCMQKMGNDNEVEVLGIDTVCLENNKSSKLV